MSQTVKILLEVIGPVAVAVAIFRLGYFIGMYVEMKRLEKIRRDLQANSPFTRSGRLKAFDAQGNPVP